MIEDLRSCEEVLYMLTGTGKHSLDGVLGMILPAFDRTAFCSNDFTDPPTYIFSSISSCCHPGDADRVRESVAVGRRASDAVPGVGELRGGVERGDLADERVTAQHAPTTRSRSWKIAQ